MEKYKIISICQQWKNVSAKGVEEMTKCICGHHKNQHTVDTESDDVIWKFPCDHENCIDNETGKWLCRDYIPQNDFARKLKEATR